MHRADHARRATPGSFAQSASQRSVPRLADDILQFVATRIPEHQAANRRYLTVAIGCTGGRHRSVYIASQLAERFGTEYDVVLRHRDVWKV